MRKNNNWIYISLLLFILAIAWVGVSAYSQSKKQTVPEDLQKIMKPIDPNLDISTLEKLKERAI
ncbi:hypothetical protein HY310_02645 [Candidatus Microgenomates bacterium]|nr:hypothetical protein [Candidatus Microgenomates bacterium]